MVFHLMFEFELYCCFVLLVIVSGLFTANWLCFALQIQALGSRTFPSNACATHCEVLQAAVSFENANDHTKFWMKNQ